MLPASGTWLVSTFKCVRSLIVVFRNGVLAAGAHRCGYARSKQRGGCSLSCQLATPARETRAAAGAVILNSESAAESAARARYYKRGRDSEDQTS